MRAVIETGGKQYRVAVGDILEVERLPVPAGGSGKVDLPVLMIEGEKETQIGRPLLRGASVSAEVVGEGKGKKITVYRYKRRKGFDKKQGHRQWLTTIKIVDIRVGE